MDVYGKSSILDMNKTIDNLKILKLLELTSSPNDSEALSAIRKANGYLKNNNIRWEQYINLYILSDKNNIKNVKNEYAITEMNLRKERAYSQDLTERYILLKKLFKYLLFIIFVLVIAIILK